MKKTLIALSLGLATTLSSVNLMASQADDVTVSNPFAREVPPGAPASASFMTLTNHSGQPIKLVQADSNVSKIVELHTHTNDNGVMRMRKVAFMEIPANGQTELKPGGLHIMLINPINPIKVGQTVSVELTFADHSTKQVEMPVKSFKKMMGGMKHSMGHDMNHGMSHDMKHDKHDHNEHHNEHHEAHDEDHHDDHEREHNHMH
ncbi:MAG: copper chaperone PCu(A)C [Gammaproteobacteria bacterium]|nr:copper chaperone PCu(A)C [Gammaproteobacteria bacterium]